MTTKPIEQAAEEFAEKWKITAIKEIGYKQQDLASETVRDIQYRLVRAYLAGATAERERILAILEHGCPQAPVQFTYAELRREIHQITEEDCFRGEPNDK